MYININVVTLTLRKEDEEDPPDAATEGCAEGAGAGGFASLSGVTL